MTKLLIKENGYIIVILNSEKNRIKIIPNDNTKITNKINQYMDKILTYDNIEIDGMNYIISRYFIDEKITILVLENNVELLIYKDFLTNMYNRNFWEMIKDNIDYNDYILIFIDIDNLKEINDYHGHLVGDKAIISTADAIMKNIKEKDIAIHYSGDEFIIILKDKNEENAKKVIKEIKKELIMKSNQLNIKMDICSGIKKCQKNISLNTTLYEADKEMYKEKRRKKITR